MYSRHLLHTQTTYLLQNPSLCRHLSYQIHTQIMCLLILNSCWIKHLTLSKINSQYTIPPDRGFPRFGRAGWNPRWCKCGNDPSTLSLRLRNRTFQTASHIYVIHILGVWTSWTVVDGQMAAHSYRCHHRGIPRFGRAGYNPRWCKCGNDPSTLLLRL